MTDAKFRPREKCIPYNERGVLIVYKSKMLTNEEHDVLWRGAAISISNLNSAMENVATASRQQAAVEVMKELYALGAVTKDEYVKGLKLILHKCGYELASE